MQKKGIEEELVHNILKHREEAAAESFREDVMEVTLKLQAKRRQIRAE